MTAKSWWLSASKKEARRGCFSLAFFSGGDEMAQVFELERGLPEELRFVGSKLEESDGIRIVNMPRNARTGREGLRD